MKRALLLVALTLPLVAQYVPPGGGGSGGASPTPGSSAVGWTVNDVLTFGSGPVWARIATVNSAIFVTSAGGVPGWSISSAPIIALWTGTCNSSSVLGGAGACVVVSSAFSGIGSGTNTTAAMLVGSGATLGWTGTGTNNASSLGASVTCANCGTSTEAITITGQSSADVPLTILGANTSTLLSIGPTSGSQMRHTPTAITFNFNAGIRDTIAGGGGTGGDIAMTANSNNGNVIFTPNGSGTVQAVGPLVGFHLTSSKTPTVVAGGAISTTPTISGTDFVGTVSVPSTAVTTGTIATVTFGAAYAVAPNCEVVQNGGIVSVGVGHGTPGTGSFTITAAIANVSAATYLFDFTCGGN